MISVNDGLDFFESTSNLPEAGSMREVPSKGRLYAPGRDLSHVND